MPIVGVVAKALGYVSLVISISLADSPSHRPLHRFNDWMCLTKHGLLTVFPNVKMLYRRTVIMLHMKNARISNDVVGDNFTHEISTSSSCPWSIAQSAAVLPS